VALQTRPEKMKLTYLNGWRQLKNGYSVNRTSLVTN